MSPRSDDTPRRGAQPRRGTSRDLPLDDAEGDEDSTSARFGGIGDARAYTPRGRTMAERDQRTRSPRAGRTTDPFRPALQVLDGGRPQRGRGRPAPADEAEDTGRAGTTRAGADDAGSARGGAALTPEAQKSRTGTNRSRSETERAATRAGRSRSETESRVSRPRTDTEKASTRIDRLRAEAEKAPTRIGRSRSEAEKAPTRIGRSRSEAEKARVSRLRPEAEKAPARIGRSRTEAGRRDQRDPRPETSRGRRVESGTSARRTGNGLRGRIVAKPTRNGGSGSAPRTRNIRAVASEPPKLANSVRRLRLGTVMALSLFVMIGIRLVVLQVASSPADAARLLKLREDRITEITLPAARGAILDRDGTPLAHSVEARYVAADPTLVTDPAGEAAILSPLLGVPKSELIAKMTRHDRPGGGESRFEFLAQGVDISIGDQIASMKKKLHGIVVRRDERRDVPGADLAANLIGFTGTDNSGLAGIEARYDPLLRGTPGSQEYEIGKGDLDKPIPGGYERYVEPQPGTSIELTIDADLQYRVQQVLSAQAQKWKATMAGAVVIDTQTGEVLAQASYPSYNAAKPLDYTPTERDDVPSSVISDPGSVHKAFIFGAALQEGLITPDTIMTIGPGIMRGGYPFRDSHPQDPGTKMTMPGLLALSSNVGTILIADKLGKQRVYDYQRKFGLGQATDEGMPGESPGKLIPPDQWSPSASGSVPLGMSVDATLIQMAAGYNAIANNGTYIQPHLIKEMISGKDGKVTPAAAPETHPVLSPAVAAELRTMMEAVVYDKEATGTQAAVTGYRIAGKTGTGKHLIDGQYTSNNYGSFIGMAPADNPRFVVAVSADVPTGSGGEVAAPAFSQMMSFALWRYRVPPSTTQAPTFKIHP